MGKRKSTDRELLDQLMSPDDIDTEPDISVEETPRGQDSEETLLGQQELNKPNPKSYNLDDNLSRNVATLYPDGEYTPSAGACLSP